MKILFLSNIPTPYQIDLFREINKLKDIKFKYVCLYEIEPNRYWKLNINGIDVLHFKRKTYNYISFWKMFKNFDPDIIIIGGYSLPLSNLAILYAKLYKKQSIYWLERPNYSQGLKKKIKDFYLSIKLKSVNKIIAIGSLALYYYKQFNKNCYNLPYSMNLEKFYKINRDKKIEKVRFLYTGQFIDRKNILNLAKAFLNIEDKNVELWLVGKGEQENELKKIVKNDIRIKILPFVQPENLVEIYEQCDIYIIPSKHDGWALVVNEAMASAMPIIGTNKVGAVVEYIKNKENGIICDTDINSLVNSMKYYINNKDVICLHGKLNREIIRKSNADVKNAVIYLLNIIKGKK